jgi:hypothetical protein
MLDISAAYNFFIPAASSLAKIGPELAIYYATMSREPLFLFQVMRWASRI